MRLLYNKGTVELMFLCWHQNLFSSRSPKEKI